MRLYAKQPVGTVPRARQLRREAPEPERRLLRALREALPAQKWRHQTPVDAFYADILCFSEALVIEVDGDTHAETAEYDAARSAAIARAGFRVIRFTNAEVMCNLAGVVEMVANSVSRRERERARSAQPSGKGESSKVRAIALPSPSHAAARRGALPLPTGEG